MKKLPLVFSLVLFSCIGFGDAHDYPDCIRYPQNLNYSKGCGNVFVYQFLNSTRVITVQINPDCLKRSERCQSFSVEKDSLAIIVELEIAGNDPDSIYFDFCNDTATVITGKTSIYRASQGQIKRSFF
ncbi:MAG: hypothetical protein ACE5D1_08045 [Fidelibacterota bacterium]